jgi:hypothetical protein
MKIVAHHLSIWILNVSLASQLVTPVHILVAFREKIVIKILENAAKLHLNQIRIQNAQFMQ